MITSVAGVALVLRIAFFIALVELFVLCFVSIQSLLLVTLLCFIGPGMLHTTSPYFGIFGPLTDSADALGVNERQEQHEIAKEYRKSEYPSVLHVSTNVAGPEAKDEDAERSTQLESSNEPYADNMEQGEKDKEVPYFTSATRRTGLKPLTLTLTNSPSREVYSNSGSRRTVSLYNGSKRLSSVFYMSENRNIPSRSPPRNPTDTIAWGKSLPIPVSSLLVKVEELATRLKEERNQAARLRRELEELYDQSRAHEHDLIESTQQVRDLSATIEARDGTIRELCASLKHFQKENSELKEAAWRVECLKAANDARAANLSRKQLLMQQLRVVTLGSGPVLSYLRQTRAGLKSSVEDDQDLVHGASLEDATQAVVVNDITETPIDTDNKRIERGTVPHDIEFARASSLDSIFKPATSSVLRPNYGLNPSKDDQNFEFDEAEIEYDSEEHIEFEFPTISPKFHLSYVPTPPRSQVVVSPPLPGIVIYEVDGSALANARKDTENSSLPLYLDIFNISRQQQPPELEGGYHGRGDRVSPDQTTGYVSDYQLQRDSDFYLVSTSAFISSTPLGQNL